MILTVTLNPAIDKALEVPDFRVGTHARAVVRSLLPAGKGNNVARGAARLGGRAVASGFIGREEEGLFARSLAEDEVESRFQTVEGRTRTNTTVLDPEAHTTTHLREEGFEVAEDDSAGLTDVLLNWIAEHPGAPVVFAGSLPRGMEPEHFAAMLVACADAAADILVDTNGPALRAAFESGAVTALKPNLDELGELTGQTVPRDRAVEVGQSLTDRVPTVLLTLGADGAYLLREDAATGRRCPLQRDEVRNTVGCGDAFLAGWLRGGEMAADPDERLEWAVAAGAASATSETTVGYTLEDVRGLLPRCEPRGPTSNNG
jgi:1-phosphofructokinase